MVDRGHGCSPINTTYCTSRTIKARRGCLKGKREAQQLQQALHPVPQQMLLQQQQSLQDERRVAEHAMDIIRLLDAFARLRSIAGLPGNYSDMMSSPFCKTCEPGTYSNLQGQGLRLTWMLRFHQHVTFNDPQSQATNYLGYGRCCHYYCTMLQPHLFFLIRSLLLRILRCQPDRSTTPSKCQGAAWFPPGAGTCQVVTMTFPRQVPNLIVRYCRKAARLDHPLEQAFLALADQDHPDKVCLPTVCACAGSWYCEGCAVGHWTNTSRARLRYHERCSVRTAFLLRTRQCFVVLRLLSFQCRCVCSRTVMCVPLHESCDVPP